MFHFSHPDLDGHFNRLVGRGAILQLIDPNDNGEARWQITAVNDILFERRLPCESSGEPASQRWEPLDPVPSWSLIRDWWQSQFENWTSTFSNDYRDRWSNPHIDVYLDWSTSRIAIGMDEWPQMVACPDCGDWIMWHEDGYVPGHRSCRNGCGRHWQITQSSGSGVWTLEKC